MPFDAADSDWRDDRTPGPRSREPLRHIRDLALTAAAVSLALLVGALAAAAVDGFPSPQPIATGFPQHQGSIVGEIAGAGSFLLVFASFVWWRVRRDMAE